MFTCAHVLQVLYFHIIPVEIVHVIFQSFSPVQIQAVETNTRSSIHQRFPGFSFSGSIQLHLLAAWSQYLTFYPGYFWGMWSQTILTSL